MLTPSQVSAIRLIVLEQFHPLNNSTVRERAEKLIHQRIISSDSFPDVSITHEGVWQPQEGRSHQRYLHGFLFLNDWFGTVLADESTRHAATKSALDLIQAWVEMNPWTGDGTGMAYHDETTAQRMINLLRLEILISDVSPEHTESLLRPLLDQTARILASPDFHSPGNNHGMFQDLALAYYSVLADWAPSETKERYFNLSLTRLKDYFSECFTSEGVHIENTPTYHVMVSRHLGVVQRIVQTANHPDSAYYTALLSNAEKYATHALMPNGIYPPVSDTTQRRVDSKQNLDLFNSQEFLYAATAGKRGSADPNRILVLPESGYAIYRSSWGDQNATYAFFSAAYNGNYHKHSDDLSLYLRSQDTELLTEAGPYSYDYKDPLSKYAYSQFSHNSLIVDNQSLPRTDDKAHTVRLHAKEQTPNRVVVLGTNGRYPDTEHSRELRIDDSAGTVRIDIVDTVISSTHHSYKLLWHLGTDIQPVVHGQGFELYKNGAKVMDLAFTANVPTRTSVHYGRVKPRPMGWRFPKFGEAVPTHTVSIEFEGKNAEMATTIRLNDYTYQDRQILPAQGWKRHQGTVPVNYLYIPPKNGRPNKLVIVFSAINRAGDFTYNYKKTVDESGIGALYILDDFGDQGAYYYSDHRSTDIFDSVQKLIKLVMEQHGYGLADVAMAGSSKGGSAALIHGLALGAARIIVGAPQTRIGTFVRHAHPNILKFMSGGTSEEDVDFLDSIISEKLRQAKPATKIFLVVGEKDHHLRGHVTPFLADAESAGVDVSSLVLPGLPHGEIGRIYRDYLSANLEQWTRNSTEIALPYSISVDKSTKSVRLRVHSGTGDQHAYRLFHDNQLVESCGYSDSRSASYADLAPGVYRVRVYSRSSPDSLPTAFTTRTVRIS
ncbi:heparinase II/III domain-containing protein [Arthrobacter sp. NPDC055585]